MQCHRIVKKVKEQCKKDRVCRQILTALSWRKSLASFRWPAMAHTKRSLAPLSRVFSQKVVTYRFRLRLIQINIRWLRSRPRLYVTCHDVFELLSFYLTNWIFKSVTLLNKLEKMNAVPFSLYTCSNTQKSERSLMYLFICFLEKSENIWGHSLLDASCFKFVNKVNMSNLWSSAFETGGIR